MSQNLERRLASPVAAAAVAILVACALLASCGKKESGAGKAGGDKVLAKVEGTEIKQSDIDVAKEALPTQYQGLPDSVLMPALIEQLIERRAAVIAAEKAGVDKDPKVLQRIAQSREDVIESTFLKQQAEKSITDAQVRDAYQKDVAAFVPQTEVRARHILTADEAGIKLAEQRIADGESFEAVASEMSIDQGSAQHGGDLGYFTRDKMVKAFGDVAFAMKPGDLSQPFKSQYGWHLVKVLDRRQTQPPTFEQAEPQIRAMLTDQLVRQKLKELRNAAKVERFDQWAAVTPPVSVPEGAATEAAPSTSEAPAADAKKPATSPAPAPAANTPPASPTPAGH